VGKLEIKRHLDITAPDAAGPSAAPMSGCDGHVANLAGYMLAEPVMKLTVEGGEAAY
jgi:hypothetical protein